LTAEGELRRLIELSRKLADRLPLETLLGRIVDGAAELLDVRRVSVRLLDPTRTRLIAVARSGAPMHADAGAEFRLGEGLLGWIAQHQQPLRLEDAERDERFLPRADQRQPLGAFVGAPLVVAGRACIGVISAVHPDRGYFSAHHEELLTLVAGICAPHVEVARLSRLSQVDPLTGALNRRGFDVAFPEDAAPEPPLSVAMADIDHFKTINDTYGHAIGDEVLKHVAYVLGAAVRVGDAVVRWGGEEFLLVLPGVDLQAAWHVAERARTAVAEAPLSAAGIALAATVSIGVAERHARESRDALVRRADEALYTAKQSGRNRVELAAR
jgi:diguanylate cyclase (GGDEF)-like protein